MHIRFTTHALERMEQYDVTVEQVEDCVRTATTVIDTRNNRKISQKRINGYVLRVIYEERPEKYIVITAYRAKRERYEI